MARRSHACAVQLTMAELLRFIASHLMFLFDSDRYRVIDSRSRGTSGDGFVVLESDSIRLRLVRDRSQMHLEIQPNPPDGEDWFGIGVARRWLLSERPGFDYLDESSVTFLRDHLGQLESELIGEGSRKRTLDRLRSERSARADEMFGRPPS